MKIALICELIPFLLWVGIVVRLCTSDIRHFYFFKKSSFIIVKLEIIRNIVQVFDNKDTIDIVNTLNYMSLWNYYLPSLSIRVINVESYDLTIRSIQKGFEVESGSFVGDISEIGFPLFN